MINICLSHLLGVCYWAFILDNLIESNYVFIEFSFRICRLLIWNEGYDPIGLITMYLLSIKLNLLGNRSYLAPIEWCNTVLNEIVFSETILIRKVHNVCNLPVISVSLSNNDVCVDKLLLVFFWLGLKHILLFELNVNSIPILSHYHQVILLRLTHAHWFNKHYWVITR